MSEEPLVKISAAAKHLGISTRKLYDLVRDGVFPAYHIGRALRFRLSDLDRALGAFRTDREGM